MRRLLAAGLLAIPIRAMGQPVPDLPPLPEDMISGLRPLLVAALAQSPQMIAHNIEVAQAEGSRISDRSGMLPSLGSEIKYGSNTTASSNSFGGSSSNSGLLYGIHADQPIFHWGALKAQADIGKIELRIAERDYADAYRQLILSVRTQFLLLIEKKVQVRNAAFALQEAEAAVALTEDKVKAKTLPSWAMVAPQMAVDDARLARDRMVEDLENSARVLALNVGEATVDTQNLPNEIPKPVYAPETTARLLQRFLQERGGKTYAIANLRDRIRQADLNYQIARVRLRPMLGFNAYFSQQPTANVGENYVRQYITQERNFNLVAEWSIFDGLDTRGKKLSALSSKRDLERTLRTTVDMTMVQARDLAQQMDFSWRALDLTQRRCDGARNGVESVVGDVKLGLMSANNIDVARAAFYQSELNLAMARAEFLNYWSQFVSTLCVDPMLGMIPDRYLQDGK